MLSLTFATVPGQMRKEFFLSTASNFIPTLKKFFSGVGGSGLKADAGASLAEEVNVR